MNENAIWLFIDSKGKFIMQAPPLRACIFNFSVQRASTDSKFCLLVPYLQTQK